MLEEERENKQKHVDRNEKVKVSEAGKEEEKTIKHRETSRETGEEKRVKEERERQE